MEKGLVVTDQHSFWSETANKILAHTKIQKRFLIIVNGDDTILCSNFMTLPEARERASRLAPSDGLSSPVEYT